MILIGGAKDESDVRTLSVDFFLKISLTSAPVIENSSKFGWSLDLLGLQNSPDGS